VTASPPLGWPALAGSLACSLLFAAVAPTALPAAPTAAGAAAADPPAASNRGPLTLEASSWVFPSRPLDLTLEQGGVLAGRRLAVDLFVDRNQWQRVTTKADRTPVRLALPELAPGRHILMAKAGRETVQTEFRVIPWSWLAGALGALALTCGGLVRLLLQNRRRHPVPAAPS
jgi:hypothetical protein